MRAGARRVLVVDDHDVVQWGFRLALAREPWVERCLTATDGAEALELARRYKPDVALVDLFLGEQSGADLGAELIAASPATRLLLMSGAGWISPAAARAAGASGFVAKDRPALELVEAVRRVAAGATVFERRSERAARPLSEREAEVLRLMGQGRTNPEIAAALHLSAHTVKEHTSALYRKLAVPNRTAAVARAERLGLLDG